MSTRRLLVGFSELNLLEIKPVFASIGDAFADQEIRAEARQTAFSFFDALGATFQN
jgi:hypothetical protein